MDEQIRIRLLELLDELLGLAAETGMKRRITDALQEAREWTDVEEMTPPVWERILRQVEETLRSMERQLLGEPAQVEENGAAVVSQEEVCQRVTELWNQSNVANIRAGKGYEQMGKQYCRQVEHDMYDWSNPVVNGKLLKDSSDWDMHCIRAQQEYDHTMTQEAERYMDEMAAQYIQAMNRIRELTASVNSDRRLPSGRDFYEKWDTRLSEWVTDLKNQQKQAAAGGYLLREFGDAHSGNLQSMVKKTKQWQFLLTAGPILLVIALVVVPWLVGVALMPFTDMDGVILSGAESGAKSVFKDVMEETAGVSVSGLFTAISLLKGAVCILGAALYVLWMLMVKKLCRRRLLSEMKAYLSEQVRSFWNKNLLEQAVCRYFTAIREHTMLFFHERRETVFGHAFTAAEKDTPAEKIKSLRMKWNQMKNEG